MELICPDCGHKYDVDASKMEDTTCPECGFGPETCSHPAGERESERIYDVGEGKHVEYIRCSKCGLPVNQM